MTEKIIGYRGLINGELILYISRILYNLGLKVLVCDCSPDKELKYIIPDCSYEIKENEVFDYRGIKHTDDFFTDYLLDEFDVVLINFGFAYSHKEMSRCNYFYYVTDLNKIHIDKLSKIKPVECINDKNHLLIKDVVHGGIAVYACADNLMHILSAPACSIVKFNKRDIKIKTLTQYNNRFKFEGISRDLYEYLYFCVCNIYADMFSTKRIMKAISMAMKGK